MGMSLGDIATASSVDLQGRLDNIDGDIANCQATMNVCEQQMRILQADPRDTSAQYAQWQSQYDAAHGMRDDFIREKQAIQTQLPIRIGLERQKLAVAAIHDEPLDPKETADATGSIDDSIHQQIKSNTNSVTQSTVYSPPATTYTGGATALGSRTADIGPAPSTTIPSATQAAGSDFFNFKNSDGSTNYGKIAMFGGAFLVVLVVFYELIKKKGGRR